MTEIRCPNCGDFENLIMFADEDNKEYIVYCNACGYYNVCGIEIETKETYTSEAEALEAFADGKTRPLF
mgnify:CR=1 FL=1